MKKLATIAFVFLCVFMCISSAHAVSYDYKYVGNYFNEFIDSSDVDGGYTTEDRVEISFTTNSGLLPDTASTDLSILDDISTYIASWIIIDGRSGYSGVGSPLDLITLAHVTGGQIDAWNFNVADGISQWDWMAIGSTHNPGVNTIDFGEKHGYVGVGPGGDVKDRGSIQIINSEPIGTWGVSQVVPEPTTMLLFGLGLLGLAGVNRRKT